MKGLKINKRGLLHAALKFIDEMDHDFGSPGIPFDILMDNKIEITKALHSVPPDAQFTFRAYGDDVVNLTTPVSSPLPRECGTCRWGRQAPPWVGAAAGGIGTIDMENPRYYVECFFEPISTTKRAADFCSHYEPGNLEDE